MTMDYKAAGVDVEAGNRAVLGMKACVERTFSPQVLTGIGHFASMFDLKPLMTHYQHPVLVQSIDGVGTKMMVAKRMQRFDTIGIDLVSATTNDIVVVGAKPLTLLDYIANETLNPDIVIDIVTGMANACAEQGISLVGGETAEMPGTYLPGEFDVVGVITGVVEKDKAILGQGIEAGDVLCALPSSGLHTNGYSLARRLFFDTAGMDVDTWCDDLGCALGDALLAPHINYHQPIRHLLDNGICIKGMAHITGGGLVENLPRVLPKGLSAAIYTSNIPVHPLFERLQRLGQLPLYEMHRTFNMGVGLVMVVAPHVVESLNALLGAKGFALAFPIGEVVFGQKEVRLL